MENYQGEIIVDAKDTPYQTKIHHICTIMNILTP